MASSSAGVFLPAEQSSSHPPPNHSNATDGAYDDSSVVGNSGRQTPLGSDSAYEDVVSFKRKKKPTAGHRLLSLISGAGPSRGDSVSPSLGTLNASDEHSDRPYNLGDDTGPLNNSSKKDGGPLDWYVEGPGRRVGYEDLTAIDWTFEYTKERQRLRSLSLGAGGLLGYARQFVDASQIWVILILTGILTGTIAASIDVASDWLADIKGGYCSAGLDGGHFYLNKYFCCFGYNEFAQCQDWVPWSRAVNITSKGGTWFIEYFFFILFSVSFLVQLVIIWLLTTSTVDYVRSLCKLPGQRICAICQTEWYSRDKDCSWRVCNPAFSWDLDALDQIIRIGVSSHSRIPYFVI